MKSKKIYIFFLTLSILLFTFSLICNIKTYTFSSDSVKSNIAIFSSTTYGGRLPGTKENILVGETIRKEFEDSGLKPFVNNSYKEDFTTICPVNNYTAPELTISSSDTVVTNFIYGKDFKEDMINFDESSLSFSNLDKVNIHPNSIEILKGGKNFLLFVPKNNDFSFRSSFMSNCVYSFAIMISSDTYTKLVEGINSGNTISANLSFTTNKATLSNIVGFIPGKYSDLPPLVLSAHYDHLGVDGLGNIYGGALDNASGTSFLLELQKYLASYGQPKCDIIFVAFNGEEFGLLGSSNFAKNNFDKLKNSQVINFDMIGSKDYPITFMLGANRTPKDSELLSSFKTICDNQSEKYTLEYKDSSDHAPFCQKSIDALTISHSDMSKIHTPNDKAEYIDTQSISNVFSVVDEKIKDYAYDNLTIFIYSRTSLIIFSVLLGFFVSIPFIYKKKSSL